MYLNGHGNIKLTNEIIALRSFLLIGGFPHADDTMEWITIREMKRVFPRRIRNPSDNHPIFNSYFYMPDGLPKYTNDNKPAQALALFENERMIVLYTYESDLGDGWEDSNVHNNPWPVREAALKMGVNIIYYAHTMKDIKNTIIKEGLFF